MIGMEMEMDFCIPTCMASIPIPIRICIRIELCIRIDLPSCCVVSLRAPPLLEPCAYHTHVSGISGGPCTLWEADQSETSSSTFSHEPPEIPLTCVWYYTGPYYILIMINGIYIER
jgi:hypothetical protein